VFKNKWNKVAKFWNEEAGDAGVFHQKLDIDPVILKIIGDVKNKNILEIGCGNGYLSRILATRGAKVTAVDVSSNFLKFAIKKEKIKPLGINYLLRNASKLYGLKDDYCHLAIANMCLMDIADLKSTIKEISRVLKKNGSFIFSLTHPLHEVQQQWVIIKNKNKKFLARAIHKYLSSFTDSCIWTQKKLKTTFYHRPLQSYFQCLKEAGFLIKNLKEIPTKQPPLKAEKVDGDVELHRSKYRTLQEKKMKILATEEIPCFLIIEAIKIN